MLASLAFASVAVAAEPIGHVKTVKGEVQVTRGSASQVLAPGQDVFEQDDVSTGADAAVGITFKDDTTFSMGPKGRMTLDKLVFDPAGDQMGMGVKMMKGTFAVVGGQIPRLAPDRLVITTPVATIGIRGTSFLVEVADDQ